MLYSTSEIGSSPAQENDSPERPSFPFELPHVIGPGECATLVGKIDALQDSWISRNVGSLFTLGAAAYLDAPDPKSMRAFGMAKPTGEDYLTLAKRLNPVLVENFAGLYQRLADTLADKFEVPVVYHETFALPGFHVFLASPDWARQASHVPHFDRPYATLDWGQEAATIDFRDTISFTLTLQLPQSGGGLRVWNANYYQATSLPQAEAKEYIRNARQDLLKYELGGMIVQTGNELHQIAPWISVAGDRRVTFQGHGIFHGGRLVLYW